VYELERKDGTTATVEDFSSWYIAQQDLGNPITAWEWAKRTSVREKLDDDFSIMQIIFN
jgi:hypothetical protein